MGAFAFTEADLAKTLDAGATPGEKPALNAGAAGIYNGLSKAFPFDEKSGIDHKGAYQNMMVCVANLLFGKIQNTPVENSKLPDAQLMDQLRAIFHPPSPSYWLELFPSSSIPRMMQNLLKNIKDDIPSAQQDAEKLQQVPNKLNQLIDEVTHMLDQFDQLIKLGHKTGILNNDEYTRLSNMHEDVSSQFSRVRTDLKDTLENQSDPSKEVQDVQQDTDTQEKALNKSHSTDMKPRPDAGGGKPGADLDMDMMSSQSSSSGLSDMGSMGGGAAAPTGGMAGGGAASGGAAGASSGAVTGEPVTTAIMIAIEMKKQQEEAKKAKEEAKKQQAAEQSSTTSTSSNSNTPKPRPTH